HNETVKSSFTQQARNFSDAKLTLSSEQYIRWIIEKLPLDGTMTVIDFACGTGILSRAIAPLVKEVIGLDLTAAMLEEARTFAAAGNLPNVRFIECAVESLDETAFACDLAVTRFSLHHFIQPAAVVKKMASVVKSQGHVAIVDLLSPMDAELSNRYNDYERLRDPSHIRALTCEEIQTIVRGMSLTLIHSESIEVEVNVQHWLHLTK